MQRNFIYFDIVLVTEFRSVHSPLLQSTNSTEQLCMKLAYMLAFTASMEVRTRIFQAL